MAGAHTHPADVLVDDVVGLYRREQQRLEGIVIDALRRGLDPSRLGRPDVKVGDATAAYRLRQLEQANAILGELERQAGTLAPLMVGRSYGAGLVAIDRVSGAPLDDAVAAFRGRFGRVHVQAVEALAGNMTASLTAATQRARANLARVFEAADALDGALPASGRVAGVPFLGRRFDDAYRRVALESVAGGIIGLDTRRQTSALLARRLVTEGVTTALAGFVDRRGRRWSLAAYTAMVARTTTREAMTAGTINRLGEHGLDLVTISQHLHPADECTPYEGRTYSLSGTDGRYPRLDVRPPFHPNCVHVLGPADVNLDDFERELGLAVENPRAPARPAVEVDPGRAPAPRTPPAAPQAAPDGGPGRLPDAPDAADVARAAARPEPEELARTAGYRDEAELFDDLARRRHVPPSYLDATDAELDGIRASLSRGLEAARRTGDTDRVAKLTDKLDDVVDELDTRRATITELRRRKALADEADTGKLVLGDDELRELLGAGRRDVYEEAGLRPPYGYNPDLFLTSDLTGAKIRHYVRLPNGQLCHPDELIDARERGRIILSTKVELPPPAERPRYRHALLSGEDRADVLERMARDREQYRRAARVELDAAEDRLRELEDLLARSPRGFARYDELATTRRRARRLRRRLEDLDVPEPTPAPVRGLLRPSTPAGRPPLGPQAPRHTPDSDDALEAQRIADLIAGDPGPDADETAAWLASLELDDAAALRRVKADRRRANAALNKVLGPDLARFIDRAWGKEERIRERLLAGNLTVDEVMDLATDEYERLERRKVEREVRERFSNPGAFPCFSCKRFKTRPSDICQYCGDNPIPLNTDPEDFDRGYGYDNPDFGDSTRHSKQQPGGFRKYKNNQR